MITSEQVLTHHYPVLPVRLACDASPTSIGAVLSDVMPDSSERPVAFASRSLTKTECKYAQIDKEALLIVWGVKRFHVYLYGRRFKLVTDDKPLTAIFHLKKESSCHDCCETPALCIVSGQFRLRHRVQEHNQTL